ncbi:tetraspanin family domain-containing protein [Ditylenchus destructor]|uniref:Tetraspanin family domain-containing protein n=1 Tax=Ditylenchus destructor TaxID=166010 RepID=A0AAD4R874_9BILA|nr:tetraspanin family domain-containing protein [Ditylenchus destructor]
MGDGLGCGARTLKFCLFIFNLLFLICGCVCLGIGYEKDDGLRDLATKPTAVRQIGYLLLVGGFVVIFVAFLGCCGAAKEWRPLLCCYASCLMIILAIEIAAGLYAAMHSNMFDKDFRQILKASLKMYNGTDSQRIRGEDDGILVKTAWDKFMVEKQCCGVDSKLGEFNISGWYNLTGRRHDFPPACCPTRNNGKLQPICPTISRYGEGCYAKIKESLQTVVNHFRVVMYTALCISLIQACAFVAYTCNRTYMLAGVWYNSCIFTLQCHFTGRNLLRILQTIPFNNNGCHELLYYEHHIRISIAFAASFLMGLIQICSFAIALQFHKKIEEELLYLY